MTNELEKTFFDTFGIEPKCVKRTLKLAMPEYNENDLPKDLMQFMSSQTQVYHIYPEITDRILLELICILSGWKQYCISYYVIDAVNINTLKSDILRDCICMLHWYEFNKCSKGIKQKVQTLFKDYCFY